MKAQPNPKIVIIGAGFGGLFAARTLAGRPVDVLLIDRHNYHTFTPLLYQVATSGLDPSEIAYPVRHIFRNDGNIRFLMGQVIDIDHNRKQVRVKTNGQVREAPYDYLIVAAGSVTTYFGNDQLAGHAFELKSLADAVAIRNHILRQFERAAWTDDEAYARALTTLVVVGGGPTGLEMAGALYELKKHVLEKEYTRLRGLEARVILVEATDRLLAPYPENLQEATLRQLESLGVEVILYNTVAEAGEGYVRLRDGLGGSRVIPTYTLIWAAGVQASPLATMLDVKLARGGRVPVQPTLETVGREAIYVVGDMAYLEDPQGRPYPMLIPVAQQQGRLAARNILRRLEEKVQQPFRYNDRGIMATIGRNRAVAWIFNRIALTGFVAWVAWLGLHLITLMGFRNRLNVFVNWVWNYFTYDRSVRIILEPQAARDRADAPPSEAAGCPNTRIDEGRQHVAER